MELLNIRINGNVRRLYWVYCQIQMLPCSEEGERVERKEEVIKFLVIIKKHYSNSDHVNSVFLSRLPIINT